MPKLILSLLCITLTACESGSHEQDKPLDADAAHSHALEYLEDNSTEEIAGETFPQDQQRVYPCKMGSPPVVIFNRKEDQLEFCDEGTWLPIAYQTARNLAPIKTNSTSEPRDTTTRDRLKKKKRVNKAKRSTFYCKAQKEREKSYHCTLSY